MSRAEAVRIPTGRLDHEHAFDVWVLEELIDDLEAEIDELRADLVDARRVRGPVAGGPPPEWDAWIMALPGEVFAECLGGAKNSEHRDAQLHDRGRVAVSVTRSVPGPVPPRLAESAGKRPLVPSW